MLSIGPKIVADPRLPLAMFATGDIQDIWVTASKILEFGRQCDTASQIVDWLPSFLERRRQSRVFGSGHGSLYLAWWAPETGFEIGLFDTSSVFGRQPWHLYRGIDRAIVGSLTEDGLREHGLNADFLHMSEEGLSTRGYPFMEAMRRQPGIHPTKPGGYYCIGGQLQMCTVTSSVAHVRTIGMWADALGQKIDPNRPFRWNT